MKDNGMRCEQCNKESMSLSGVSVFCGGGIGWVTMYLCAPCYVAREERKSLEIEKELKERKQMANIVSEKWTLPERMAVVFVLTDKIRDDINAGIYSLPGRPNIQSVHLVMSLEVGDLEKERHAIEYMIRKDAERFAQLVEHYSKLA